MNKQTFDFNLPNGKKQFQKFLDLLLEFNMDSDNDTYYEIHVYPNDCSCMSIEWQETPWGLNKEWGGQFKWVDVYDDVYTELHFPDDHYEMVPIGSQEDILKEWHKDNPEWVKSHLGTWTNKDQNASWAIENNLKDWLAKEQTSEDHSFIREKVNVDYLVDTPISKIIRKLGVDVLKRVDYVVIGEDLINCCFVDDNFIVNNKEGEQCYSKLGELLLPLRIKEPWRELEETIVNKITIYVQVECASNILYLTDYPCLIARQECVCSNKESSKKAMEDFQKNL